MMRKFIFLATVVFLLPLATGCEGPTGPEGPMGATGAQGSEGAQGSQGATGPQGPVGPAGQDANQNCVQCHVGDMTLYAKQIQWAKSAHGIADALYDRTSCSVCHSHQGFLERVATGSWTAAATITDVVGINCRTCHKLHTTYTAADYGFTTPDEVAFRVAGVTVDLGGSSNLCATCHQSRLRAGQMAVIDGPDVTFTSSHYGPHGSPQGDMMAGLGFYMFDNTPGGMHTHGFAGGCSACHMPPASETKGGHTWNIGGDYTVGCEACHTSGVDDFGLFGTQAEIQGLLTQLGVLMEYYGIAHFDGEEWHPVPGTYPANVTAAYWNFAGVMNDGSLGLHNPPYIRGLLESSIAEIKPEASPRGFVGAATCKTCHATSYAEVFDSGHPYKLNKVNGAAPTYPFSTVPSPPAGVSWADVTYVIGGYGWKARFMGQDGYIITAGGQNQYNLATQGFTDYHKDEVKPYNCGACHTTGWQTLAENGGVHQDGLEGISGTWEEPGVTCEACHGPGLDHVLSQSAADITVDNSSAQCGTCHIRGDKATVPAKGGFIRHHEQYNELLAGAHTGGAADVSCNTCHDPHIGTKYGHADAGGIVTTCETCHSAQAATNAHIAGPTCVDCHMAMATKSALAVNTYTGDVRTHLFAINPDGSKVKADMFNAAGSFADKGWVSLDVVCYSCHKDGAGVGGTNSMKTMAELSAKATGIHN